MRKKCGRLYLECEPSLTCLAKLDKLRSLPGGLDEVEASIFWLDLDDLRDLEYLVTRLIEERKAIDRMNSLRDEEGR